MRSQGKNTIKSTKNGLWGPILSALSLTTAFIFLNLLYIPHTSLAKLPST